MSRDASNRTLRADGRGSGFYDRRVAKDADHRDMKRKQGPRVTMDKRAKDGGNYEGKRER